MQFILSHQYIEGHCCSLYLSPNFVTSCILYYLSLEFITTLFCKKILNDLHKCFLFYCNSREFCNKKDNMSFNNWWLILYFGIVCQTITKAHYYSRHFKANALKVVYQWKYFDYNFGSNERRQAAIQSGKYNYKNNFPIDVDRWHGKVYKVLIIIEHLCRINSTNQSKYAKISVE